MASATRFTSLSNSSVSVVARTIPYEVRNRNIADWESSSSSEVIVSSAGVQQGDPLGPLYFCFALNEIASLGPVYQKWYMDDGGIVASVPVLLKVWALLREKGPALGLHLNPNKCEWSWLDASRTDECPLKDQGWHSSQPLRFAS